VTTEFEEIFVNAREVGIQDLGINLCHPALGGGAWSGPVDTRQIALRVVRKT
jgi:hypothetical protein